MQAQMGMNGDISLHIGTIADNCLLAACFCVRLCLSDSPCSLWSLLCVPSVIVGDMYWCLPFSLVVWHVVPSLMLVVWCIRKFMANVCIQLLMFYFLTPSLIRFGLSLKTIPLPTKARTGCGWVLGGERRKPQQSKPTWCLRLQKPTTGKNGGNKPQNYPAGANT